MTVPSDISKSGPYIGDGVSTVFPYDFKIVDEHHLRVVLTGPDGVGSDLIIGSDYSVTGVGQEAGGTIIKTSPLAVGYDLTLLRNVPFVQETDLQNQGAYYAETVEDALDLAAMRDQQLREAVDRAVKVPENVDPSNLDQLVADITYLADVYLGAKPSDPTVRNDGSPLKAGDMYFNTTLKEMRLYDGTQWMSVTARSLNTYPKSFVGDGSETEFLLDLDPAIASNVFVWVGGVRQVPDVDYTVSGATVTLVTAPGSGVEVDTLVLFQVSRLPQTMDGVFDSRADVEITVVDGMINTIITGGYYAGGDGGGAMYKRVASEPSHAGKVRSADGAWWEIAEISFNIMMFGARKGNVNTYAVANTAAIQAAIDTAHAMGVREVIVPTGVFVISTKITMPTTYNVNLRGYGRGSQIKGGTGYSGEIILYGGSTSTGGILGRIADMTIGEVLSGTCNGVFARNANTGQITGVYFRGCDTCIVMENSFSLKVHLCDFSVPSSYAIASLTGCHNLLVDTCWMWTTGLAAIYIAGISNNIVITNCDIEYCLSVIQTAAEVRSLIFVGNYVEGSVDREFNFDAIVYGFTCDNNVIELRGAVPGSGVGSAVESTYINIRGGSFRYNTMHEQKIAFGASCEGIEVIPGRITYNEGAGGSDRSYLKDQLYKTPAFINGWADGATYPFGFQRSGSKVRVKGSLLAGSGSADNPAFVLPAGYFPDTQKRITCMTSTGTAVAVIIDAFNGNFVPQTAAPGTTVYTDFEYHCIQPLP